MSTGSFVSGLQIPSWVLLVQHGEDDLRGLTAGLRSHFQVGRNNILALIVF
jgi:hypothetical protein